MTASTVGLLLNEDKDVFRIIGLVDGAIRQWRSGTKKEFRLVLPGQVYINILINEGNSHRTRTMQACFHCDGEHADCGPKSMMAFLMPFRSVSFSLGQNDEAVEIMEHVLAAVAPLGDTYIVRNDSLGMPPERFPRQD